MNPYEQKILRSLLDSYENSLLSRGENKVAVHISFPFTKTPMPKNYEASSPAYDEIHEVLLNLERQHLIRIDWKDGREGHIVKKAVLCDENVDAVYRYVHRTPKSEYEIRMLRMFGSLREECRTPVASALLNYLQERVREGKSIREYAELSDTERAEQLLRAVAAVEENRESCFIREFSLKHFHDSKVFESLLGPVGKAMHRFEPRFSGMDIYAILAEYGIYHTPNFVYMKGEGTFSPGGEDDRQICLNWMRQGIGLSGEDIGQLDLVDGSGISKVITVENLTTYFSWYEPDSIIIYLGGYHNSARRSLLRMLYERIPEAEWYHFGDIDADGYLILEDLKKKTGIPFRPYHMGVEELKAYGGFAKPLTDSDRKRLKRMIEESESGEAGGMEAYRSVFEYMLEHGVKLEQECIRRETE